ncbi:hypothetical protein K458DRAFT_391198 [Lentithecium fluviatile CBS 122367]|uniref:RNA polymerase I-specific transcription initiation factor RRN6-like protein n=1 Tax=Lentithecium fluviatile CBS 122367 TaxID=1168545 RepID=A0A6G1IV86_9PLEO|nr:hypothetical protein K458DRAFT_391198 [Lentithecium fluviatile CBS 122367]
MIDTSSNGLNYGHFGAAVYDLESNKWAFSRDPRRKVFLTLPPWRAVRPAAIQYPTPGLLRPARSVHQATRELARDYPQLAPAAEQLSDLDTVSAAAISATNTYDATVGSLLSFGSITCKSHSDHRPKPVVATATGEVGNILQLQILEKERHGWDSGLSLEGPSLDGHESGYWNDEAAPIRQICFAEVEERRTFLAVRLPQRTVLFQPYYSHSRRSADQSKHFHFPPSSVVPHPFYSITEEDTGGLPHAHVSFNPEYQRQVGIVDERGNWSIWDIDHGYTNENYTVTCSAVGGVGFDLEEESTSSGRTDEVKEDGWARILWVGDANSVVVANRRHFRVFNVKTGVTLLKSPIVISERSADWILDVKRHPSDKKYFFILSSTRLYLMAVTCPSDDPEFVSVEPGTTILMSWTHFRGLEDITLQLCVHKSSDEDCMVLLHSRLNTLITVYCFGESGTGASSQCSSSDPSTLSMEGFNTPEESHRIIQLHLHNLSCKDRGLGYYSQSRMHQRQNVRFYQLIAVLSDLSVREVILHKFPGKGGGGALPVGSASWVKTGKRAPCHGDHLVDDEMADDDFIQPDGLVDAKEPLLKRPCQPLKSIKRQTAKQSRHVFDYSLLYNALPETRLTSTPNEDADAETVDVSVVVQEAERMLFGELTLAEPPLGTLLEFAGMRIAVSDVDEASARLQDAFPSGNRQFALELQYIASGHVLGLIDSTTEGAPTIASLYDAILQNWIAPLSADIPVRVRQSKERLARCISAEVILACIRIRHHDEPGKLPDLQPGPSQDTGIALPTLASQLQFSGPSLSQPSSPFPDLASDHLGPPASTAATAHPLSRLSKHLRIDNSKPGPITSGISQVLSQWQPGTDPRTYSWDGSEEALQEDTEADETSQQKREKAQRRKERREKKQKRENELFKATTASQPQVLRSSPGPFFGAGMGLGMSSQLPATSQGPGQSQMFEGLGGLGVQSQVEPGKHGGRPVLKKKKGKKRVGGF